MSKEYEFSVMSTATAIRALTGGQEHLLEWYKKSLEIYVCVT